MDPALGAPDRQWLAGIDAEAVQRAVAPAGGKLRAGEPAARKLVARVGHVLAAEDAEPQHLLRRQFGLELGVEMRADRRDALIAIALLHPVVHHHDPPGHASSPYECLVTGEVQPASAVGDVALDLRPGLLAHQRDALRAAGDRAVGRDQSHRPRSQRPSGTGTALALTSKRHQPGMRAGAAAGLKARAGAAIFAVDRLGGFAGVAGDGGGGFAAQAASAAQSAAQQMTRERCSLCLVQLEIAARQMRLEVGWVERLAGRLRQQRIELEQAALAVHLGAQPAAAAATGRRWPSAASSPGTSRRAAAISCAAAIAPSV